MSHNLVCLIARKIISIKGLIIFVRKSGGKKLWLQQEILMVTLKVTQKTMSTSIEVMIMKLGITEGEDSGVLCSYACGRREYTLREEGKSHNHL